MFECNSCGACCKLLVQDVAPELDRGDGVCTNLKDNRCSIYETRPDKCRQGHFYPKYEKIMTRDEYDNLGMEMCIRLEELANEL